MLRPSDRRYLRICQGVGVAGAILWLASLQIALRFKTGVWGPWLAAASGLGFFAEMVSVGLLVYRKLDEFQRILLIRSFLWSTVITMGLVTVWGVVDLFLHHTGWRIDVVWIPIFLITATGVSKLLIFRKFRSPAE